MQKPLTKDRNAFYQAVVVHILFYKNSKMKTLLLLSVYFCLVLVSCNNQTDSTNSFDSDAAREEIIEMYNLHLVDLGNLDHEGTMTHYAKGEDHILFGDGKYWGDYETVSKIWKNFIYDTKQIITWDISEQHINLLSESSASYLMEFYQERIKVNGDTAKVKGSVAYGLVKGNSGWKIATTNITHQGVDDD